MTLKGFRHAFERSCCMSVCLSGEDFVHCRGRIPRRVDCGRRTGDECGVGSCLVGIMRVWLYDVNLFETNIPNSGRKDVKKKLKMQKISHFDSGLNNLFAYTAPTTQKMKCVICRRSSG